MPRPPSEMVEVVAERKVREAAKAVLWRIDGREIWLPKSQVEADEMDDGTAVIKVPDWLAVERGLA